MTWRAGEKREEGREEERLVKLLIAAASSRTLSISGSEKWKKETKQGIGIIMWAYRIVSDIAPGENCSVVPVVKRKGVKGVSAGGRAAVSCLCKIKCHDYMAHSFRKKRRR